MWLRSRPTAGRIRHELSVPREPRACSAALVLALGLAPPAIAAQQAEVYRVQHRTAEELLPYAEATLGGEGRVVVDSGTNSLVLFSERQDLLRSALALLATQDRALRTVVLEYASQRTSELAAEGVRIDWGVATGGVRIGNLIVPAGDSQRAGCSRRRRTRAAMGALAARCAFSRGTRGASPPARPGRSPRAAVTARRRRSSRPIPGFEALRARARRRPRAARAAPLRGEVSGRRADRDVRSGDHVAADAGQDRGDRRVERRRAAPRASTPLRAPSAGARATNACCRSRRGSSERAARPR